MTETHGIDAEQAGQAHALPSSLIASLNEVAGAVSSAMSVSDVLGVVVEQAKRITDTDKAVLALADETGRWIDPDSIVVRGKRGQHDQEWWETRLNALGEMLFASGEVHVERHPEEEALLLCSPLLVRNQPVGVLAAINSVDRPFTDAQLNFVTVLSAFAASAIERARLSELTRNVMLSTERERIASEMHDGPVQSLFSISLGLEVCKKQLADEHPETVTRLDQLQEHLSSSMTDLRRIIYELSPARLSECGLAGAIQSWLDDVAAAGPVRPRLVVDESMPVLSRGEQACLYRVAKEAVSNALRHAGARTVEVGIHFDAGSVRLEVRDDGSGFDSAAENRSKGAGMGLQSIRQSVERAGGRFSVSTGAGSGTSVLVELPVGGTVT